MEPPADDGAVTNEGCSYFDEISPPSLKKGASLLEFYAKSYTHTSRASWQDKILRGLVKISTHILSSYCSGPFVFIREIST
jgi:hypothetical protein